MFWWLELEVVMNWGRVDLGHPGGREGTWQPQGRALLAGIEHLQRGREVLLQEPANDIHQPP
jgi:hypothetical protein